MIWAEQAHYVYTHSPGEDKLFAKQVHQEMKARGLPPLWSTADRNLIPFLGDATDDDKPSSSKDAKDSRACNFCGFTGHIQKDCRKHKAHLAKLAGDSQQQAPHVNAATPNDTNNDAAFRPGSRLHNKTNQQNNSTQSNNTKEPPICPHCTKINNGTPIRHWVKRDHTCVLADPEARPPPKYNTDIPLIRKELNRRWLQHDMGELPPCPPRNPKVGFAGATMYIDDARPSSTNNKGSIPGLWAFRAQTEPTVFNRAKASHYSQSINPTSAIRFDVNTRIFTCVMCDVSCSTTTNSRGYPTEVFCTQCSNVHYATANLPAAWLHASIWTRPQPASLPVAQPAAFGSVVLVPASQYTVSHSAQRRPVTAVRGNVSLQLSLLLPRLTANPADPNVIEFARLLGQVNDATQSRFYNLCLRSGLTLPGIALPPAAAPVIPAVLPPPPHLQPLRLSAPPTTAPLQPNTSSQAPAP